MVQVQQYASRRASLVDQEEPSSGSTASMQLLWKLLQLQAAHHSKAKAPASSSKSKTPLRTLGINPGLSLHHF